MQISQEAGQVVWYSHLLKSFPQFVVSKESACNAGLDKSQAGIEIARRNINNLRYADDTTLMAESEEELKSLLMKMNEESEKASLKINIQKTKITASGPINFMANRRGKSGIRDRFYFLGLQNHWGW